MASYHQALADARDELANLPKWRELIDRREAQLKKIIEGLESYCESGQTADLDALMTIPAFAALQLEGIEPGLQEACRAVIYAFSPTPVSPTDVRDALETAGFSTKNYSNPMATIHKALKRLSDDPDSFVKAVTTNSKTMYLWVPKRPENLYDKMVDPGKLKEAVYEKKPWMRPDPKKKVPQWFEHVKNAYQEAAEELGEKDKKD